MIDAGGDGGGGMRREICVFGIGIYFLLLLSLEFGSEYGGVLVWFIAM